MWVVYRDTNQAKLDLLSETFLGKTFLPVFLEALKFFRGGARHCVLVSNLIWARRIRPILLVGALRYVA